jgi:hypothetical protein
MRILGTISLFCFLLLSFTSHAQISIGIKGGPDFSKLTNAVKGDNGNGDIATQNSGTLTQFYGSVFVDIPLDSGKRHMFYIRPAVEYIGAGGKTNPDGDYYNSNGFQPSTKYTLRYIDVPVEFVFSPNFDWGRPMIGLGLYGGSLVSGKIKGQDSSSRSVRIGNSVNDDFQRIDFGYTFSIGLITKVGFLFGVDYQHSFLPVVPSSTVQANQSRLQTHNSVWGLHLGWVVKL